MLTPPRYHLFPNENFALENESKYREPAYCPYIVSEVRFYGEYFAFCCHASSFFNPVIPKFPVTENAEATIKDFLEKRNSFIDELHGDKELKIAKDCADCKKLIKGRCSESDIKIKTIAISCYPSPCQARCIYCDVHTKPENSIENCKSSPYPRLIAEMISYLKTNSYIDKSCKFGVSPAEVTIMPHKKVFLDAVSGYKAFIPTNGFIFDEQLARSLKEDGSTVNVSLDSGTPETYMTIKGANNFERVLANIKKYRESGIVSLKYIVIPGVNDGDDDIMGMVNILDELNSTQAKTPVVLTMQSEYGMPFRSSYYAMAKFAIVMAQKRLPFRLENEKYTYNQMLDFAAKLPETEEFFKQRRSYLTEVFRNKFKDNYKAYRQFIYKLELSELIRNYSVNSRFCVIGEDTKAKNTISTIEESLHRKIFTAKTPELALEYYDCVDVFISPDAKKTKHLKQLIGSRAGLKPIVVSLDEYMGSFGVLPLPYMP